MIPLSDVGIQRRSTPIVTGVIVVACVLGFVYQLTLDEVETFVFTYRFGAIPAELFGAGREAQTEVILAPGIPPIDVESPIPNWATVFTSMFIHGGFLHLGANMLFLWTFGKSLEDRYGHLAFTALYLVSGLVAFGSQSLVDPEGLLPMVGASGAVAGVLGAYVVLYPLSRINTLVFLGLIFTIRIPAVVLLGFWAALQSLNGLASLGPEVAAGGIAYFAHLGGFVFGIAVSLVLVGGRAGRRLASRAMGPRNGQATAVAPAPVTGPRLWSSVLCPNCGDNVLEFNDELHQWHCPTCDLDFS